MISKRDASAKRATVPRSFTRTKAFVKDWERHGRAGRFDMRGLKKAMLALIANDGPLPPEYKDHVLAADWADHRDCHVHSDFLLLYKLEGKWTSVSV